MDLEKDKSHGVDWCCAASPDRVLIVPICGQRCNVLGGATAQNQNYFLASFVQVPVSPFLMPM